MIRAAKLGRSRLVPIHPNTCTVMADYSGAASSCLVARSRPIFSSRIAEPDSTWVAFMGRSTRCRGAQDSVPEAHARGHGYMTFGIASRLKC